MLQLAVETRLRPLINDTCDPERAHFMKNQHIHMQYLPGPVAVHVLTVLGIQGYDRASLIAAWPTVHGHSILDKAQLAVPLVQ